MKIHEFCRQKRQEAGLTQKELASLIGIRRATITDFENGKHGLSSNTLDEVFKLLKIKLI